MVLSFMGQEDQTGSTADSLSLHKPDLEESEPDKKAHTTNQWSLQKHFELDENHDWEEAVQFSLKLSSADDWSTNQLVNK